MKKGLGAIIGIIVVIMLIAFPLIGSYNGFVNAEEDVDQQYAQIENQLQRRMDLIPNLVNTVKGYASHEEDVIEDVASARSRLAGAGSLQEQANADADLTGALGRLLVISESYPDLKADQQFTQLMDELSGTENRIAVARKDYNDQVTLFNKKVKQFPGKLTSSIFGFDEKAYFKADAGAKDAPKVDFEGNEK
ncbi:LemA family protein [Bacillus sp. FSL K6-3431]|uniref:LemA family protein n=1 Tax=Bacillus sp. FSL K6-3431 TaxID=2921500 RepID=UPI0030F800E0